MSILGQCPKCGHRTLHVNVEQIVGVVGMLQATEVLKLLLGIGMPLTGRLLHFDALAMRFRETRVAPDPGCVVCAPGRPFPGYIDYGRFCAG